jgi:hypothetical protein
METCPACGGDGECKNDFHNRSLGDAVFGISVIESIISECPACGSSNTEMGGKCSICGGTGEVED